MVFNSILIKTIIYLNILQYYFALAYIANINLAKIAIKSFTWKESTKKQLLKYML